MTDLSISACWEQHSDKQPKKCRIPIFDLRAVNIGNVNNVSDVDFKRIKKRAD